MKPIQLSTVVKLSATFSALGIFLMIIGLGFCSDLNVSLIVLLVGLLVLVGTIIFMAVFLRCPYCGGSVRLMYRGHYCQHCGRYLT